MTVTAAQAAQMAAELSHVRATTVAVETYSGEGGLGPVYASSANITCYVVPVRRLVRNDQGVEVVSELTLHAAAADETKLIPESRITIGTRVSKVITAAPKNFRGVVVDVEVACS